MGFLRGSERHGFWTSPCGRRGWHSWLYGRKEVGGRSGMAA